MIVLLNIAGAKPGSALAWLLIGLRGVGYGQFFVKISFSLVDISLDVEFQSSRMLRTQITHFNPI